MSRFRYLLGAAILAWLVAPAYADTVTTFTLDDVTFDDGGTATGQFTLDFTTGIITSANITTSADIVTFGQPPLSYQVGFGTTYDLAPPFGSASFANSSAAQFSFNNFFFDGLSINLENPLTLADVTAPHNSFLITLGSESAYAPPLSFGTRNITGGSLDIGATPLPAALPLFVSGAGLIGGILGWRRKRKPNRRHGEPLEASAAAA